MSVENEFVARFLERSGNALAGFAAAEMLEVRPDAATGLGSDTLGFWKTWFERRVEELVAAVSAGKPKLFEEQVQRAASHFAARNPSVEVVGRAFQSLRTVLATELPENAQPIVEHYLAGVLSDTGEAGSSETSEISTDTEEGKLAASYLVAILEGDRQKALSIVFDAASAGWSISDLYLQVFAPVQREIGQMWIDDEINIADEHFATTTTKVAVSQLYAREEAKPANGKTVLAAAAPGNRHDVGLQMITNVFEMDGWRTIPLGADVPTADLIRAVAAFQADLLLISAAVSNHLAAVRDSIRAIRRYAPTSNVKILVGGAAFAGVADLAKRYGADGYAANATDALRLSRRLVDLWENVRSDAILTDCTP